MTNPRTDIIESFLEESTAREQYSPLVRICNSQDEAKELVIDLSRAYPHNEFRVIIKSRSFLARVEVIAPSPDIYDSICAYTDGWGTARRRYYL